MARRRFSAAAFGLDIPPVTFQLLVATAAVTLSAVVGNNFLGLHWLADVFVLFPEAVVPGLRLWEPLTYVFYTGGGALGFVLTLVGLYFFGSWFERSFGSKRLLRFYLLSALGSAALPVAVGLFSPSAAVYPYFGPWPVFEALTVAFGTLQPEAQVYLYMVLPVSARQMMYGSWALIALFVVFGGGVVPYLAAIGGIGMGLALTRGPRRLWQWPRRLWLQWQARRLERQLRRRAQHLRVVTPVPRSEAPEKKPNYLN